MGGSGIFSRDAMTAYITSRLKGHDEWNSVHCFEILRWEDGGFTCSTLVLIDPRIEPEDYPQLIEDLAAKHMEELPGELPAAFVLHAEGHAVIEPDGDASDEEKRQFRYDRANHRYHLRPDAIETYSVIAADIYGRLWIGHKRRDAPDDTSVDFHRPGNCRAGGRLPRALLQAAGAVRATAGHMN